MDKARITILNSRLRNALIQAFVDRADPDNRETAEVEVDDHLAHMSLYEKTYWGELIGEGTYTAQYEPDTHLSPFFFVPVE